MLSGWWKDLRSKSWLPDLVLIVLAWWAAFWLRFNLTVPQPYRDQALQTTPLALLCMAVGLLLARVPRQSWRYVGLADLRQLAGGVALGALLTTAVVMGSRTQGFPRSVFLISGVLALLALAGARATWRTLAEYTQAQARPAAALQPLLIVGTIDEADQALRTLKGVEGWQVVGIASPRAQDAGRTVQGVRVLGGVDALDQLARAQQAGTVLLASAPGDLARRDVLMRWSGSGLNLLTLPTADELLRPGAATRLRQVRLEDLLGRTPVQLDARGLAALFSGQTVLVTGAGGSIGSELCRQVARLGVARLVCVDVSEYATYRLEQELRQAFPAMEGVYYTANVREPDRLRAIALAHRPGVVLHAAAYKHVPLMETHNEIEALRTNVLGTLHAARVAGEVGAARFVLVSTDKAVNPTNVMGATKRLAEQVVQAVAREFEHTQYVSVRFGNVLGSSGSVVPLFTTQIELGGPVTVTHPEIVRYFMTIPEAAQLVLQAGLMGRSGQIFVLDMGEPVKIVELARLLIRLSGKTEAEVPIAFTGLRPGEKLYEELLADDETTEPTPHPKLRVARVSPPADDVAAAVLAWLAQAGAAPGPADLRGWLHQRVPEYQAQPVRF
ncbi:nucleoside-diphosphate sugar epimerase/dehydratase [Ottowia sp. SB7-C50]|uniref:polysaccharide biosynthesis protein n=1 Tax=Ottowia sp. SB7-C50 TaxID=3081231 RepID=UPI0029545BF4|nr:nucleoside-diphosphate sugar epimerase/dehydratase [Ottowia sp. SB7-C50]WOP16942.1 nucleoside-diphosphate sugar epimerase/dehydratase [Ottowia sp. SB7-C50]